MLSLLNFATLVANMAAAAQASCSLLVDFAVGSVERALIEANATVCLWVQWLVLYVLSLTRAATSVGPALDTWMADFGFVRLAATYATGRVTLGRYATGSTVNVAPGVQVKTSDGTQTFTVLADPSNATGFWNAGAGAYQITGTTATMSVLVQAVNAGTQGNVVAGSIALLASSIPGIDYCTNAAGFTNAANAETDAAFRARFALWIDNRSLATAGAIQAAVLGVQIGLSCSIQYGVPYAGAVTVYIDDGSGATPSTTIAAVQSAVNAVVAGGISIYVQQAPVTNANINIAITSAAGYVHATQVAAVNAAVTALVGAGAVGATLPYAELASTVYGATPGIAGVPTLTINSAAADLPPGVAWGVVRLATLTVA